MITRATHSTEVAGVRLQEQHTTATLGFPGGGFGLSYRRPVAIEHRGETTPLPDVVFRVRAAALAMVILAIVFRRFTS